jgi:hypothetical protein
LLGLLVDAHAGEQTSGEEVVGQAAKEEMCRRTICQHNLHVTLRKKDGSKFDKTFDVLPGAVQPSGLAILAGQTLYIEADRVDDKLVNFRVVAAVTHPEKTLVAAFQQSDDGGMLLKVSNPFSQALKFDMGMMPLDRPRLRKTSSCPVVAGGSSFEMWAEPLFQVTLANARFVDLKNGNVACD